MHTNHITQERSQLPYPIKHPFSIIDIWTIVPTMWGILLGWAFMEFIGAIVFGLTTIIIAVLSIPRATTSPSNAWKKVEIGIGSTLSIGTILSLIWTYIWMTGEINEIDQLPIWGILLVLAYFILETTATIAVFCLSSAICLAILPSLFNIQGYGIPFEWVISRPTSPDLWGLWESAQNAHNTKIIGIEQRTIYALYGLMASGMVLTMVAASWSITKRWFGHTKVFIVMLLAILAAPTAAAGVQKIIEKHLLISTPLTQTQIKENWAKEITILCNNIQKDIDQSVKTSVDPNQSATIMKEGMRKQINIGCPI